ncbi:MAG: hypothetical protein ACM3O7_00045 [Acidobacteriota bacterium]
MTFAVGVTIALGLAAGVLAPPEAVAQTEMRAPTAEVEIIYFRRAGDENLMMGSVTGTPPQSSGMRTITVDAGDAVLFQWAFRTRHAVGVAAVITYGSETISLTPGTPQTQAGGWTKYENQRNVTIRTAGVYTLRVTARPGAHAAEKNIRVNVHSASLETLRPDVNPSTRRVTFAVRNSGNADAAGRFTVTYQIQGRDPTRSLVESSLQTGSVSLQPHQQMELGHVDLPESAWQSAQLWMRVRVGLVGPASVSDSSHDFTYSWPARELRISAAQLRSLGVLLGGEMRIHNYSSPGSDTVNSAPFVENASYINLMGENIPFTFQRIVYEVAAVEHFFFVNDFRAPLGGETFLDIENGKLVMRANFNSGRSEREVKGWTRDYVLKRYVDNTTPDVDIQRFDVSISLTPTLRAGKISYRDPTLGVDSQMRFPGGWAWLNGFKDRMNREVQSSVRANFTAMLNRGAIKTSIEDRLTEIVMALGAPLGIHDLTSVRGSGNEIIVAYR